MVESDVQCDSRYFSVCLKQQLSRLPDPVCIQVFDRRLPGHCFEKTAKLPLAHRNLLGDFGDANRPIVVLLHVDDSGLQPVDLGRIG
ncbi:hypothetical protein D3C78_1067110 [compost metagenome]